jgi:hypothetical protein
MSILANALRTLMRGHPAIDLCNAAKRFDVIDKCHVGSEKLAG